MALIFCLNISATIQVQENDACLKILMSFLHYILATQIDLAVKKTEGCENEIERERERVRERARERASEREGRREGGMSLTEKKSEREGTGTVTGANYLLDRQVNPILQLLLTLHDTQEYHSALHYHAMRQASLPYCLKSHRTGLSVSTRSGAACGACLPLSASERQR